MLDLRNPTEAERYPAPMDRLGGRLVHLPFPSSSTDSEGRDEELPDLPTAYRFIAELSGPSISALFTTLAEPSNLPAVVFCAAGKDRTGVAIALVLGALEVEHEEIAKDYAITGRFDPKTIGDEYAARYDFLPDSYRDSDPETMQQLLDGIATDHGSIRGFVIGAGVEEKTLRDLKARLVV
jgi:protein-tyrosine phosphatase